ncbi:MULTISPECIES: hypothetical protein [Sorangium]|uniref:hypothetical protein n=1 Tax=Sorangium TaxID=39643 RepID=UPI003D9C5991
MKKEQVGRIAAGPAPRSALPERPSREPIVRSMWIIEKSMWIIEKPMSDSKKPAWSIEGPMRAIGGARWSLERAGCHPRATSMARPSSRRYPVASLRAICRNSAIAQA